MTNDTYTSGTPIWYGHKDLDAMQEALDKAKELAAWRLRLLGIERAQHTKVRGRHIEIVEAMRQEIEGLYDFIEVLNVALAEALGNPIPWNGIQNDRNT